MSTALIAHRNVNYELVGDPGQPVITFLNGLTQNANLWKSYAEHFVPRGYRVLAYDMLGQGKSSKPVIDIGLSTHADMLASLLEQLDIERTHLAPISFGGICIPGLAKRPIAPRPCFLRTANRQATAMTLKLITILLPKTAYFIYSISGHWTNLRSSPHPSRGD